jgi:hypothetical protein
MPPGGGIHTITTSPEIIRLALMFYVRFPLSLRNVEDLLHERGIEISNKTVRFWCLRFGPLLAAEIRRKRVSDMRSRTEVGGWTGRRLGLADSCQTPLSCIHDQRDVQRASPVGCVSRQLLTTPAQNVRSPRKRDFAFSIINLAVRRGFVLRNAFLRPTC